MRTLVDIPEPLVRRLDERAKCAGRSRAALIREAVNRYLGPEDVLSLDQVFGLWGDHTIDGLEYQRRVRGEWDRASD
ncbi:MAG TPA: CopG family transcriptional regulator [Allosphingosinicella sp.]|jgi:hypothetical protein